ncbi:OLC1v1032891C1 [Oldenlandia corymbosa var. corymbosa]|uniref:OLC1v1032891C1 n=1 Tax=Oldenlandia corymbosa var. corymbosa TaxID=529605 RepID=A0AAV1CNH9_OLDCO|nr:OLC1v1032891C1 [Oldenlandia corymbosa var. corymbosa]
MATLQRSTMSYRREGSSGAVWGEKLLPELILEKDRIDPNELRHCHSVGGPSMLTNHHSHSSSSSSSSSSSDDDDHHSSFISLPAGAPPAYISRSSSLSVSALKLLNPKSVFGVGQKFRGAGKPPKYGKQFPLVGRV